MNGIKEMPHKRSFFYVMNGETLQRGGSKSLILGWFVLGASGAPKNRNKR